MFTGPDVTDRFDRVFWLGDFNFRVDMKRADVDQVLSQYKEQKIQDLKVGPVVTVLSPYSHLPC